MPSFLDHAGDSAARWSAIGFGFGFVAGCAAFARQSLSLRVMGSIGIVAAFFAAAGASFGILFEAFGHLK